MIRTAFFTACAASTFLSLACAPSSAASTIDAARCASLKGFEVPPNAIGLPTKGAVVNSAEMLGEVAAITDPKLDEDGELRQPLKPRCVVQGEIQPMTEGAPPIRFAVNLPAAWNKKSLHNGGGGLGGSVITGPGKKASGRIDPIPLDKPYPVNLGYATYGSDGGHNSDVRSNGTPANAGASASGRNALPPNSAARNAWLLNDEAFRNWAGDALKKTHDVAQLVIEQAYGEKPAKRYFTGESAGAREAMWMAQRYPDEYDGYIATSAVLNWTYIHIADNDIRSHLVRGWLDENAIKLIADHTRKSCDAADGLEDGIIARYLECPNTAAQLRCSDGKEGEGCLSDSQIASVNTIRNPWSMRIELSHGQDRYAGFGVTGNEDGDRYAYAFYTVGTTPPLHPLPDGQLSEKGLGNVLNFSNTWIRAVIAQDTSVDVYNFDPYPYRKRIQYVSSLIDAMDPDLEKVRAKGAKILLYQPSADNAVGTPMVADYYRKVVETMGREKADEVLRFYVGPGGGHNATGITQIDTLSALENWVEKGVVPADQITAVEMDPITLKRGREMPACLYPKFARYNGTGDPSKGGSFTCESRPDPMAYAP